MALTFRVYTLLTFLAAAAVVWHAFHTRQQFYPAMVYLHQGKLNLAALGNAGLWALLVCARVQRKLFLGALNAEESQVRRAHFQ